MSDNLKNTIISYVEDNVNQFTYDELADLSVVFATKMDPSFGSKFFKLFRDKFMKELQFLKDETMYKIVWSYVKAGALTVNEDNYEWMRVKDIVSDKVKQMDTEYLTNFLVLSTLAKNQEDKISEKK